MGMEAPWNHSYPAALAQMSFVRENPPNPYLGESLEAAPLYHLNCHLTLSPSTFKATRKKNLRVANYSLFCRLWKSKHHKQSPTTSHVLEERR